MTWKPIDIKDIKEGQRVRFRMCGEPNEQMLEYHVTESYQPGTWGGSFWTKENGSFSKVSAPFEVWVDEPDGLDKSKVREGDFVTLEVRRGNPDGYTVSGRVRVTSWNHLLYVGPTALTFQDAVLVEHTPKEPEWWSWPLIRYDGHVYGLDTQSSPSNHYHVHGRAYCGCAHNPMTLRHVNSTRSLEGVTQVVFADSEDLIS